MFLLYFVLRRDVRAVAAATTSFAVATLVGFALAWKDSWEYWTVTVGQTDRIGDATLNTNQNAAGALAPAGVGRGAPTSCCVDDGLPGDARRDGMGRAPVLAAGEPTLALICIALFGLVVSPVSWSHRRRWGLPAIVVTAVVAYRCRDVALALVCAAGAALMTWPPIELLPEHQEAGAAWWRQVFGMSGVVGAGGHRRRGMARPAARLTGGGLGNPSRWLRWAPGLIVDRPARPA